MKNQNVSVSELIRGMKNIERMRGEIEDILSGLNGRLYKLVKARIIGDDVLGSYTQVKCGNLNVRWEAQVYPRASSRRTVMTCYDGHGPLLHARAMFTTLNGDDNIAMEDVESIYDSLQMLVDAFMEQFPVLKADAEIIRRAAAKFPERNVV